MSGQWIKTDLSVIPAYYELAASDRVPLEFQAGETITAAFAKAYDITVRGEAVEDNTIIENTDVLSESAVIVVTGGERGKLYELQVQFTDTDNRRWTRTLVLKFVA